MGADVEDSVKGLVTAADGDVAAAECGIVYVDEVDKLAYGGSQTALIGASSPGTVNTKDVQTSLLKVMEDGELHLPSEKRTPTRFGQVPKSFSEGPNTKVRGGEGSGTPMRVN